MEAYEAHRDGRLHEFYASHAVDDDELEQGLLDGTLALDTRLRDALRALRADEGAELEFSLPPAALPLTFSEPGVDESDVAEIGTLGEADDLVRLEWGIRSVEHRSDSLEAGVGARLRAALATRVPTARGTSIAS